MRILNLLIVLLFLCNGCYTFSTLQSARCLKQGYVEFTPSYSSLSFTSNGSTEKYSDHVGVQVGYGCNDQFDLRFRYELIMIEGTGGEYSFVAIEPKISAITDLLAISIPTATYLGEGMNFTDGLQFHPTLISTIPINKYSEINLSAKALFMIEMDDILFAFNGGIGIGPDLSKMALRPEIGVLLNPGEEGYFFAWNIGLSISAKREW